MAGQVAGEVIRPGLRRRPELRLPGRLAERAALATMLRHVRRGDTVIGLPDDVGVLA